MKGIIVDLSVILVVSAVMSYVAVLLKQPVIIAYIISGIVIGPLGAGWIKNTEFIGTISHLGVTLLLFLAGLNLHPQKLSGIFKKVALITITNCLVSFAVAFSFARIFYPGLTDSICIGVAMMFSSTILVVKLLPTTRLHHEKMGALCIGILILQDLIAIAVLAFIRCINAPGEIFLNYGLLIVKLLLLIGILVLSERFILGRILVRVERLPEMLFLVGLAWCFGIASVSHEMGLFYETGAFFAGVVLARHKISFFISERLKPLRDFFLVLFFFTLGAEIKFFDMRNVAWHAALLALIFILIKPALFRKMLILTGEGKNFSLETGIRLGQLSEFSLLIALLAFNTGHITRSTSQFIQLVTIFTFVVSSYVVVLKYPTPVGTTGRLIRD